MPYADKAVSAAWQREWRRKNPEIVAQRNQKYRLAHLEYFREHQLENRRSRTALLAALKAKPCSDCESRFDPVSMDFDHVRGSKVGGVSDLRLCSLKRLLDEIAKCELVCANCHASRTEARRKQLGDIRTGVRNHQMRDRTRCRAQVAKAGPCVDCTSIFPPECMQWDHVRGVKHHNISGMQDLSDRLFYAEVAKCDLVCTNCHRLRTQARLDAKAV